MVLNESNENEFFKLMFYHFCKKCPYHNYFLEDEAIAELRDENGEVMWADVIEETCEIEEHGLSAFEVCLIAYLTGIDFPKEVKPND